MKRKAETTASSYREIFDSEARTNLDAASKLSFVRLESTFRKRRRAVYPKLPTDANEAIHSLEQDQSTFSTYFKGAIEAGKDKGIFFSSSKMLARLENYHGLIQVDGTFAYVPAIFDNMVTIMTLHHEHALPVAFVLLTGRTEQFYSALFNKLKELVSVDAPLQPQGTMSDFERAFLNALSNAFPSAIVHGCYFHYVQAVFRNLQKLGLRNLYRDNEIFKRHVKLFMALPLLPTNDIRSTYDELSRQILPITSTEKSLFSKFKKYILRFWLNQIGPEKLSVFGVRRKTNNNLESFHAILRKKIKQPNPNFYLFLEQLNNCVVDNDLKADQLDDGVPVSRPRDKKTIHNENRLRSLEEKLSDNRISPMEFLRASAYHVHDSVDNANVNENNEDEYSSDDENSQETNSDNSCVVCLTGTPDTAIIPCSHIHCENCSNRLLEHQQHCPRCRGPINSILRIYQ